MLSIYASLRKKKTLSFHNDCYRGHLSFMVHYRSISPQASFSFNWEWSSDHRLILQRALLDVIFGFSIWALILTSLRLFVYVAEKRYLSSFFCIKITLIPPACYRWIHFRGMRSKSGLSHTKPFELLCWKVTGKCEMTGRQYFYKKMHKCTLRYW